MSNKTEYEKTITKVKGTLPPIKADEQFQVELTPSWINKPIGKTITIKEIAE